MKTIGCYFGRHTPVLVAVNTSYYTSYTNSDHVKYHMMRFYQCEHCGARSFKTNYDEYGKHNGIENAKDNWIDAGVVPNTSYDPRTETLAYVPVAPNPAAKKKAKIVPFKVIKGGKV